MHMPIPPGKSQLQVQHWLHNRNYLCPKRAQTSQDQRSTSVIIHVYSV